MRWLVTGADGFIGRSLCRFLEQKNNPISKVVRRGAGLNRYVIPDINDPAAWDLVNFEAVDVVVHLAGKSSISRFLSWKEAKSVYLADMEGAINLCVQAKKGGVKKFIYMSSARVMGLSESGSPPFNVSDEPKPNTEYAQHKLKTEKALLKIAEQSELEVLIVRPPPIYGRNGKGGINMFIRASCLPLKFQLNVDHSTLSWYRQSSSRHPSFCCG